MANLHTAAPQLASSAEFRILLPEASEIALADMLRLFIEVKDWCQKSEILMMIFERDILSIDTEVFT